MTGKRSGMPVSGGADRQAPGKPPIKKPAGFKLVEIKVHETLIEAGRIVDALYELRAGEVQAILELPDGRKFQQAFRPRLPGTYPLLGASLLFSRQPSSRAYVALSSCQVVRIGPDQLRDWAQHNRARAISFVRSLILCSELRQEEIEPILCKYQEAHPMCLGFALRPAERLLRVLPSDLPSSHSQERTLTVGRKMAQVYGQFAAEVIEHLLNKSNLARIKPSDAK